MCGRFTLRQRPDALARAAGITGDLPLFTPRFNIAPSQDVLAFRAGQVAMLRWGLVPSWAKEPAIGARMINARAETLAEKPSFRAAFRARRCALPADGFYEWQTASGAKQPFFIRLRGDRPFALAGLWERWRGPDGAVLETCAIITTTPNAVAAAIHDRMPVILADGDVPRWLDAGSDAATLGALLAPCPAEAMEAYPVSPRVNRPANDDATLVAPLNAPMGRLL